MKFLTVVNAVVGLAFVFGCSTWCNGGGSFTATDVFGWRKMFMGHFS